MHVRSVGGVCRPAVATLAHLSAVSDNAPEPLPFFPLLSGKGVVSHVWAARM
jgi:hypothetical protein